MSVETMSRRISIIEQSWKDASEVGRAGLVVELSEISTGLGHVTGPEAVDPPAQSRSAQYRFRC